VAREPLVYVIWISSGKRTTKMSAGQFQEFKDELTTLSQYRLSNQYIARHPSSPILGVIANEHFVIRAERKIERPLGNIHGSNTSLERENEMHTRHDNRLTITKNLD
jgi:hypothetical protein